VDRRCVDTLRMLAVDMVEQAGSGHPGLPLGAAPMAWALWSRFLCFDPDDPAWPDRDRFVLSAGHGSALLYALLHLFGCGVEVSDLTGFRQWGSRTPGHPEHGHTPGVEVTTGPLGQGIATAVGLALGERMAAARYNPTGAAPVVDHRTWVLCSDGDLMEGVSGEASSLAGHLGLGRLAVLWDDNRVSIDGPTSLAFSEDVPGRYRAYGWRVIEVEDGDDLLALDTALAAALDGEARPTLVRVHTVIGRGAPTKQGTAAAHGAPLGAEEVAGLRAALGWTEPPFDVPAEVRARAAQLAGTKRAVRQEWARRFRDWSEQFPERRAEWDRRRAGRYPKGAVDAGMTAALRRSPPGQAVATRVTSGRVLDELVTRLPELVGGSADLAESTGTALPGVGAVAPGSFGGQAVHFGVREHAMAAMANGLALYGGYRPFCSTFLVFSDYARPAIRLAALMGLPVTYLFTHDSIGLGEDGPTHQPVEHLAALRAIPGLAVIRPADGHETMEAWRVALGRRSGPTALALSRQALPASAPGVTGWLGRDGARVVRAGGAMPDLVIVATGSEVALALAAAEVLEEHDVAARVVSMPWRERFLARPPEVRGAILGTAPVLVVEAGASQGWDAVGEQVAGLDRFGASAPGPVVQRQLGFSIERVVQLGLACRQREAVPWAPSAS